MKNEEILEIFKKAGLTIESGAQFSVRGQIAQLLNGCAELIDQCAIAGGKKAESMKYSDGQAVADAIRNLLEQISYVDGTAQLDTSAVEALLK